MMMGQSLSRMVRITAAKSLNGRLDEQGEKIFTGFLTEIEEPPSDRRPDVADRLFGMQAPQGRDG